jgi:uncharacterized protein (DUF2062 family)
MLFRTRAKSSLAQRLRIAVWPRVSWSRSAQYFKQRVVRLSGSPHAIALGVAIGSGVSFTPFLGFHIVLGILIALLIGGNLVATALGTAFGNPLTFPLIWAATYRVGKAILGAPPVHGEDNLPHSLAVRSFDALWPIVKPMAVGSVPLGLVAGVVMYVLTYQAIRAFRAIRSDRMAARRRARNGEAPAAETLENA